MEPSTIASYKLRLLEDILSNPAMVQGIQSQQATDPESPESLLYCNIYPYMKITGAQTIADSYVLLEVDILEVNQNNPTYSKYRISIKALVHEDRMHMEEYDGTRLDFLYEELKNQLDGQSKYGFSKLQFASRTTGVCNEKYHFADLTFYTNDLRVSSLKTGRKRYG